MEFSARTQSNRRGFSLLELVIALIVLGLIAAVAIPTYQRIVAGAEETSVTSTVEAALRNSVAIARLDGNGVPTIANMQTAFDELPADAAAPGEHAAGTYTVCQYGDAECAVAGTRVEYYANAEAGAVGIIVTEPLRVLGNITGANVAAWAKPDGTILEALNGPGSSPDNLDGLTSLDTNHPSFTSVTSLTEAPEGEFYPMIMNTTEATVDVQLSGGIALIVVAPLDEGGNPVIGSPHGCAEITSELVVGTGARTNCPGDPGYSPGVTGAPIGIACSSDCRAHLSATEPFAVAMFQVPEAFGGTTFTAQAIAALVE